MGTIKTVQGDILTPNNTNRVVYICHQVNCKGVMGAGLAKQIKEKYHNVFTEYYDTCTKSSHSVRNLGRAQFVYVGNNTYVVNCFGQDGYGRSRCWTEYFSLRMALSVVAEAAQDCEGGATIRIPYKIGCGLAGGDWNVVEGIIKDIAEKYDVDVEVWRFES